MSFRNPYHFVPVGGQLLKPIDCSIPDKGSDAEKRLAWERALGHRTLERYHPETFSGTIVCRLKTVGPTVVGAKQGNQEAGPTRVDPFERDGKPAIPASTLRGCISAVAEAASNSALRVLDDSRYSRRVTMQEAANHIENFSALGLLVRRNGELRLIPLALPAVKADANGDWVLPFKYRQMFPPGNVPLKAYCYERASLPAPLDAYSSANPQFCYAQLRGSAKMNSHFRIHVTNPVTPKKGHVLLGLQCSEPSRSPKSGDCVEGILRALYAEARAGDMPGKKHEMFIPCSRRALAKAVSFPIEEEALKRFKKLARDRKTENERRGWTEERGPSWKLPKQDPLPYAMKGAKPLLDRDPPYSLQEGDIVFFVPDQNGEKIVDLFISQLWRREIPATTYDFFRQFNQEILPFNPRRQELSMAEALFGFVETEEVEPGIERKERSEVPLRALASRVRFTDALFVGGPGKKAYLDRMPLKILASPKPPCPSFYFRKKDLTNPTVADCYIRKSELDRPKEFIPQGRKFYLHHGGLKKGHYAAGTAAEDDDSRMQNSVRPLRPKCEFDFRVGFDNLALEELELLMFALRPGAQAQTGDAGDATQFHHKLGMGKALGLGTVKIEVVGLFLIDRSQRYTVEGFSETEKGQRFHYHWVDQHCMESLQDLEANALKATKTRLADEHPWSPISLSRSFRQGLPSALKGILKALYKVGDPTVMNVRAPLAVGQQNDRKETFRWFQNNDDHRRIGEAQGLVPLDLVEGIPQLEKNDIRR